MRRLTSRPKLGFLAVVVLIGVAFAIALSGATHTAAPVAWNSSGVTRDTPGATSKVSATSHVVAATKPATYTPHQLSLTRAHSAVFNVRNLKSVVVKKERPEHEDPASPPGGGIAKAFPSKLTQKQMVKKSTSNGPTPSSDTSFDGLDFATWGAGHPPDENGDVGPNYYIQTVNTSIGIYDKSNGNRVAAFTFNSFMSQGHFGNLCDTNNFGDPVVLYDSYENRWVITDFAFTLSGGNAVAPAYQCFAVSKTGDPVSGGWNFYSILSPGALNDYPKFGVWTDGIYMSSNLFGFGAGGGYVGYHVWALNKA